MRALRLGNELALTEIAPPTPGPGEALLRVRMAGICSTDLEIVRGYMGFSGVLGHEMVADVLSHGDPAWVGRRVAADINLACGRCESCRKGLGRHCPKRTVLGIVGKDGCFADQVALPVSNLHPVPDVVPDELAIFVEPLAAAFEILEQVRVEPSHRVLVLGDGKLGLLVALTLLQTGCDLTLVGRHDHKLAIASEAGARAMHETSLSEHGFDIVVEATGSPQGLALALARVRPRGTVVLKSTFHGTPEVDTARIVIDEICMLGSRCGPFEPAIRALAAGRVDPRPLLSATYDLSDGLEAMAHAGQKGVLKVALDMRADHP